MKNETKVKLMELLAQQEFYDGLRTCMEAQTAFDYFAKADLELSEQEALETWNSVMQDNSRGVMLSDEQLDQVVGAGSSRCPNGEICRHFGPYGGCVEWMCKS